MISFDNLEPKVIEAMCTPMHQVLPPQVKGSGSLYIGSLSAVMEKELLRQHRISHIVQVMDGNWAPLSKEDGFNCHRIDIRDHYAVDLRPHLEGACNYIDWALRCGENVLVHCHQGVSRSASIIIAYLIRNRGMTFDNALTFLQQRRACVKPNAGFTATLREWENYWRPSTVRRVTS